MRVLMLTQAVDLDSDLLGFTHGWVNALARQVDHLHVVTLRAGRHDLAANVTLHAYGPPDKPHTRWDRLWFYNRAFARLIAGGQVDVVFVHMIPRWVIQAAPYCWGRGVPIVLWYTHRNVDRTLRLAHRLVAHVVTASYESYGLHDDKVTVVGHGIDTEKFQPPARPRHPREVVSIGRLMPSKDLPTLIQAAHELIHCRQQSDWQFTIVGGGATHVNDLHDLTASLGLENHVQFVGRIPHHQVIAYYQQADLFVNTSFSTGLDKTSLESMACGTPALVCDPTFAPMLNGLADRVMFKPGDPLDLADHLEQLAHLPAPERANLESTLRQRVIEAHNVDRLMERLVTIFRTKVTRA